MMAINETEINQKGKIIAFTGAHGTGKTTAAMSLVESLLPSAENGLNIGVIHETARRCPMPVYGCGCDAPSAEAQEWIFAAQLQAEIEACRKHDIVISDRTLVDCIAYTRLFGYHGLANAMEGIMYYALPRYSQVIINKIEDNDWLVEDGFRATDPEMRRKLERILLESYRRLRVLVQRRPDLVSITRDHSDKISWLQFPGVKIGANG